MTQTLTTEQLRALRDSLKSWQDGYDPVDDKEQYEMFVTAETAVGELLANREAQPVFFIEIEGDDWINAGRIDGNTRPDLGLLPDGINYLYAAPPAPADSGVNAQSELVAIVERLNASGYEVNGEGIDFTTASEAVGIALQQLHEAVESLSAATPAPVVPDEITAPLGAIANGYQLSIAQAEGYRWGWNACRAAMLAQPVIQGYKLVPVEPTEEMCNVQHIGVDVYTGMACDDCRGDNLLGYEWERPEQHLHQPII